ncbi:carbohydrate ABC transporter permease [Paracoccus sp. (in: a-proteobacteria)]|uniref:carbohydrate ABC transporter permease n=1 Tax=Paracoccus sp. TaxID=267 RepID=UPI0026DF4832|nr:carbohydrate ABC transporter permease [Paracoccus sp. (in: a-proteobacteria)]MDO5646775.1 carbohydrate ABC transporter permease [Paracoccus sp. (in: a-proteobacteria)]
MTHPSNPSIRRKPVRRGRLGRAISYLIVAGWSFSSVFFVVWVISASLKTNRQLFREPWSLPLDPVWGNYVKTWVSNRFGDYFLNSALVVSASVLGILIVSVPAAYVLARARFRGRGAMSSFFAFGMGIPYPLLFVPIFVIMNQMRLGDSLTGLTLAYIALSIPFSIYVLEGFFTSLPSELESAAVIDGCSDFQVFRHVMLPLAMPGIATVAILNFVGLWNEYQWSLVLLNSPDNRTLSLGIYALITSMQYSGGDWVALFAGVTIVMVPTVVLFIALSEKMISGITMGGVK